jgi:hypothetical protein
MMGGLTTYNCPRKLEKENNKFGCLNSHSRKSDDSIIILKYYLIYHSCHTNIPKYKLKNLIL